MMPRSPPAAVDSPPQSPSPHKIRNASLTKRGKPRKEKQIPTKHERLYWAQMRIGQMPDEALLQTLSHKHQIHEMRWCNADDTTFYVFMRREMVAREGMWTKICAQFGGEYVPNPEVPKYQLWKHFAAIWGEPQSGQLQRNKRFFTEKARSSYRADPDAAAERKPRPNVIGELNPLQSKASVMAIRSLIAPEGAAADTSEPMLGIAEAVMNAVYVVDPSKVPPAQAGKNEEEPAVPAIDEDDIIIPDSADEDDGKPKDDIEAGARAMRELHALVTGGKKTPAKRRRLVQRHITDTARRIEAGAAGVAPVTSSTAVVTPAIPHPRWNTPVACMPKHKRIQYRQVIATPPPVSPIPPPPPPTETVPFVELARAFLMHPDIYAIDIQTDILHVIHQFIPEASRSAAAYFDVQNVKSVLGRLFPRGATSYESYLTAPMTQSRELTTVEAHRRALRLEDMCVYLVNTLRAAVGGDDALPSLSHADAADVCVALEYHGGVHGNGRFYWLGRPETQDVLSLAKLHQHATGYQSTLRPTLDYLRDNRAKAFERTYVVADIQSWALPFILEMFSVYHRNASQPPMGHATFVNAITDLNRLRVQAIQDDRAHLLAYGAHMTVYCRRLRDIVQTISTTPPEWIILDMDVLGTLTIPAQQRHIRKPRRIVPFDLPTTEQKANGTVRFSGKIAEGRVEQERIELRNVLKALGVKESPAASKIAEVKAKTMRALRADAHTHSNSAYLHPSPSLSMVVGHNPSFYLRMALIGDDEEAGGSRADLD